MGSWSAPIVGWNVNKWAIYTDSTGVKHLYGASSLSSDSYIYEYDTGSNNQGVAVNASFETKSFDCKKPGQIKYFAFAFVFYKMVYGALSYQAFIDETEAISEIKLLGNSTDKGAGSGSMPSGSKSSGSNYDPNTTFASLQQNNKIIVPLNFKRGEKISFRFSNSNINETFEITGIKIFFQDGSIFEQ
jgi:hypothetical protein